MYRQHETLDCRKLTSSFQARVTEMVIRTCTCDNWFVTFLASGGYFLIDV
jgi:hypothetical protein